MLFLSRVKVGFNPVIKPSLDFIASSIELGFNLVREGFGLGDEEEGLADFAHKEVPVSSEAHDEGLADLMECPGVAPFELKVDKGPPDVQKGDLVVGAYIDKVVFVRCKHTVEIAQKLAIGAYGRGTTVEDEPLMGLHESLGRYPES